MKLMKPSNPHRSILPAHHRAGAFLSTVILLVGSVAARQDSKSGQVDLPPLTAQVGRLIEAMDYLGAPIKQTDREALEKAGNETDAARARRTIQDTLDKYCLFDIHINPESRVRVTQGAAAPELVEKGRGAFLVKGAQRSGRDGAAKGGKPERSASLRHEPRQSASATTGHAARRDGPLARPGGVQQTSAQTDIVGP